MIKKKLFLLSLFLVLFLKAFPFSISVLSLEERVANSNLIIEGKVIEKQSFWNIQHTQIFTSNRIKVSKVFKGEILSDTIEIVTEGGELGEELHVVEPSLHLNVGDLGVFLCVIQKGIKENPVIVTYASIQGFLKYTVSSDLVSDVEKNYDGIETTFYEKLKSITQQKTQIINSEPIVKKKDVFLSAPSITDFTPLSVNAGVGEVLTINGTDFGTSVNTLSDDGVWWINADNPSQLTSNQSDIISWSDSQIKIYVPDNAGTGIIRVKINGELIASTQKLNINYSINQTNYSIAEANKRANLIQHVSSSSGGYFFQFNEKFAVNQDAKDAFIEALKTWQCNAKINFDIDPINPITAVDSVINDNINVIRFDNETSELPAGVLGRTNSYYMKFGCDAQPRLAGVDITFDDEKKWNFTSKDPLKTENDFISVAIHELGHALQLAHVNNSSAVMHYSMTTGTQKRHPLSEEIDGANFSRTESQKFNSCSGGIKGILDYKGSNCGTVSINERYFDNENIKIFPNPFNNELNLEYTLEEVSDVTIEIVSIVGNKVFETHFKEQASGNQKQNLNDIIKISGVYNLMLTINNKRFVTRIVKID